MMPTCNRRSAGRWRGAGFALALVVFALLPAVAVGQMQFLEPPPLGTQLFQNFLNGFGLQPLATMDELAAKNPSETLLVIFRNLTCIDADQLAKFVDRGGAVLIASDRPDRGRLAPFGLQLTGNQVVVPTRVKAVKVKDVVWLVPAGGDGIAPEGLQSAPEATWKRSQRTTYRNHSPPQEIVELNYAGNNFVKLTAGCWSRRHAEAYQGLDKTLNDCIVVKGYEGSDHPIFADCSSGIVVDQPSFLTLERPDLRMLCSFPPFWLEKGSSNLFKGDPILVHQPGFIAGSSGKPESKERLLIVSGHSLFLNSALAQRELDNATFTINALKWLTDGKTRKFCLFVDEGKAISQFDVPLALPPIPTTRMINDFLRALEEDNFFNRMLLSHVTKQSILRILATAALIGLAIYGFRRIGLARHRQDYSVPLVETKLARLVGDYIPQLARRRHQALRGNDFREAARVVARECFETSRRGRLPAQPPAAVGGDQAALGQAVGRLWQLAHGTDHQPVPADAFGRIVEMARQVQAAFALGTVRWIA